MEQLLHYVWKHKIFPLTPLQTTSGLPVEVIDTGLQNTHAGPDFFNAKLKIDGTLWVGNVEIHTTSSDWYRHDTIMIKLMIRSFYMLLNKLIVRFFVPMAGRFPSCYLCVRNM